MEKEKVIQAINVLVGAARQARLSADEHDTIRNSIVFLATHLELPMNGATVTPISPVKEVPAQKD